MKSRDPEQDWFRSRDIPLLQFLLTTTTILTSWLIALIGGHVKLWPIPMISDCGAFAPEKYIFTMGLVSAAFLLFLFIWVVETAGKVYSSQLAAWGLGFPASIGLMVLATCNHRETPVVHGTAAATYFIFFGSWCLACSFKELSVDKGTGNKWPFIRQIISLANVFFSLYLGTLLVLGYSSNDWQVALSEWAAVLCANLYTLTFYWDLGDHYFIEQVQELEVLCKKHEVQS